MDIHFSYKIVAVVTLPRWWSAIYRPVRWVLAEDPEADIVGAWWDPRTIRPLAALAQASRQRWHPLDPSVRGDLDFLRSEIGDAELNIASQDLAMRRLVISVVRSDAAGELLLYDRSARTLVAVDRQLGPG